MTITGLNEVTLRGGEEGEGGGCFLEGRTSLVAVEMGGDASQDIGGRPWVHFSL